MMEDPIAQLILRCAAQDRAAFRVLYADSSAKLLGVTLRILGNRTDAEDALQEVYTRVWVKAVQYSPEKGAGMSWLIAMTRNLAIDRLRARKPAQDKDEAADFIADQAPRAETMLIAKGEAKRVKDCFATLEPDRAAAVRGAYLDGHSYDDLARHFSVPLNTMRTWLRRSLLKLKECLDQ